MARKRHTAEEIIGKLRAAEDELAKGQSAQQVCRRIGVTALHIEPDSPWENGYVESFNGKLRDELLNREIFYTLREAQVLIEAWRGEYNQRRPHSALGCRPPAPEAVQVAVALT